MIKLRSLVITLHVPVTLLLASCSTIGQREATKTPPQVRDSTALHGPQADVGATQDQQQVARSRFALARLSERRSDFAAAENIYLALLQDNPHDARLHHRLGVLYARKRKFPQSDFHFQQARQSGQPDVQLFCDHGYALYLQHRLDEAEAVLQEGLSMDPLHQAANNNLGLVLGAQGRFEESLTVFMRGGSEAQARANLAYVQAQTGRIDGALANYSRALQLDNSLRRSAQAMLQVGRRKPGTAPPPPMRNPAAHVASSSRQPSQQTRESALPSSPQGTLPQQHRQISQLQPVSVSSRPDLTEQHRDANVPHNSSSFQSSTTSFDAGSRVNPALAATQVVAQRLAQQREQHANAASVTRNSGFVPGLPSARQFQTPMPHAVSPGDSMFR